MDNNLGLKYFLLYLKKKCNFKFIRFFFWSLYGGWFCWRRWMIKRMFGYRVDLSDGGMKYFFFWWFEVREDFV